MTLQHLPDFKGIETRRLQRQLRIGRLQHLPDFKGIETGYKCFKSPTMCLQHLPDFKGISNCHGIAVIECIKKRPVNVTGRFFVGLKFDLIGWVPR
jgi:hypothetical protein